MLGFKSGDIIKVLEINDKIPGKGLRRRGQGRCRSR